MLEWIDYKQMHRKPPQNRPLLAYCPNWCDTQYVVVVWNGWSFVDDLSGTDINDYVVKWSLIFEAD
jgi:hypothetical protein